MAIDYDAFNTLTELQKIQERIVYSVRSDRGKKRFSRHYASVVGTIV